MDIDPLIETVIKAGEAILEVYSEDFEVEHKEDQSPLTEADRRSNDVIVSRLKELHPDIPFISEEARATDYAERKDWKRFWLIDPLDGTKEFVKRNGEFTVNVALIEDGIPTMGFVYQPVTATLYYAHGGQSFRRLANGTETRLQPGPHYSELDQLKVVASRSHLTPEVETFVNDLRAAGKEVEFLSAGSSLKLCLVAAGEAAVYPRFGPTMEWDTGAAHAVALGAGRQVLRHPEKTPLAYNKEDLLNPWFIVE